MIELSATTPLAPVEKRTLIIAMTERSGSTNLCSVLAKLGMFGEPEEFFNDQGMMQPLAEELGAADGSDYLAKLAARSEIFCFKISRVHWRPFAHRAKTVFPDARYVFLDRLDLDAQAISLYRARTTWRWHAKAGDNGSDATDVAFDPAEVEACRQHLREGRANWAKFFFEADIKPLPIMYEHMIADMPKAVQMICGEAGVFVPQSQVPAGDYGVLRDELTEQWKETLRDLRAGKGLPA